MIQSSNEVSSENEDDFIFLEELYQLAKVGFIKEKHGRVLAGLYEKALIYIEDRKEIDSLITDEILLVFKDIANCLYKTLDTIIIEERNIRCRALKILAKYIYPKDSPKKSSSAGSSKYPDAIIYHLMKKARDLSVDTQIEQMELLFFIKDTMKCLGYSNISAEDLIAITETVSNNISEQSNDAKSQTVNSSDAKSQTVNSNDANSQTVNSNDVKSQTVNSNDAKSQTVNSNDAKSQTVNSNDAKSQTVNSNDAFVESDVCKNSNISTCLITSMPNVMKKDNDSELYSPKDFLAKSSSDTEELKVMGIKYGTPAKPCTELFNGDSNISGISSSEISKTEGHTLSTKLKKEISNVDENILAIVTDTSSSDLSSELVSEIEKSINAIGITEEDTSNSFADLEIVIIGDGWAPVLAVKNPDRVGGIDLAKSWYLDDAEMTIATIIETVEKHAELLQTANIIIVQTSFNDAFQKKKINEASVYELRKKYTIQNYSTTLEDVHACIQLFCPRATVIFHFIPYVNLMTYNQRSLNNLNRKLFSYEKHYIKPGKVAEMVWSAMNVFTEVENIFKYKQTDIRIMSGHRIMEMGDQVEYKTYEQFSKHATVYLNGKHCCVLGDNLVPGKNYCENFWKLLDDLILNHNLLDNQNFAVDFNLIHKDPATICDIPSTKLGSVPKNQFDGKDKDMVKDKALTPSTTKEYTTISNTKINKLVTNKDLKERWKAIPQVRSLIETNIQTSHKQTVKATNPHQHSKPLNKININITAAQKIDGTRSLVLTGQTSPIQLELTSLQNRAKILSNKKETVMYDMLSNMVDKVILKVDNKIHRSAVWPVAKEALLKIVNEIDTPANL